MRRFLSIFLLFMFAATPCFAQGDENWDARIGIPGVNGTVSAIAVVGDDVYVGGEFTQAGTVAAKNFAKWNSATNSWTTYGSGTDGSVTAIAVIGNDIFLGGSFANAGEKSSFKFAHWTGMTTAVGEISEVPQDFILHQNHPNPFNPRTVIRFQLPVSSHVTLTIHDQLGREVATLVQGRQAVGNHQLRFDASGLASGVYYYRLSATTSAGERFVQTRKLILMK